jgi:hypothetical protein
MVKKFLLPLAAALLLALGSPALAAEIGETFLTAYDKIGGKQMEIKGNDKKVKYTKQLTIYTAAQYAKMSKEKQAENGEKIKRCDVTYHLAKDDLEWIKAHETAKHVVVVRVRVKQGQIDTICPKPEPKKTT